MTVVAKVSRFSLFSGLCPVRIPTEWVSDPNKVRWAARKGVQYVDFTANGGPAMAFSLGGSKPESGPVEHWQSIVNPGYQEIDPQSIQDWGTQENGAVYAEGYGASQLFGTSAQVIDLVPPEPDDGVRVFPPSTLAGVEIDTSTPVRYYWRGDSFGGCGFFFAFVRSADGLALEAHIGLDPTGWKRPYLYEERSYEEYLTQRPDARENPSKIWSEYERELHTKNVTFEKDVFCRLKATSWGA